MTPIRILGLVLLAAGLLALAYGGFSYTEEKHDAKIGPLEIEVKDREHVAIPPWAGVAGVVTGIALLFVGGRRR
jgi:hypothetical protein